MTGIHCPRTQELSSVLEELKLGRLHERLICAHTRRVEDWMRLVATSTTEELEELGLGEEERR